MSGLELAGEPAGVTQTGVRVGVREDRGEPLVDRATSPFGQIADDVLR